MYIPYNDREYVDFESLVGKTLIKAERYKDDGDDEIHFETVDGDKFVMYHEQDCCEYVGIEDINGDLTDLIGEPILLAEEVSEDGEESDWGSSTWTFYKLATVKGTVVIRWLGESNGYYSESVDFVKITNGGR